MATKESRNNNKMLKLILGKSGHQLTPEKLKQQKDLFSFQKNVRYGFPSKPSSLGWDSVLRLIAIGTKQGCLRVYGKSGVEFHSEHSSTISGVTAVNRIIFLPGQGRLITLTDENTLHLWQIDGTKLQEKYSTVLEGRLKRISDLCLDYVSGEVITSKRLFLGTEGGNIYQLDVEAFSFDEKIIYQDQLMLNAPDDFKVNPGAVETILRHPVAESSLFLIGFTRGLIVLWHMETSVARSTFVANQQLESLSWSGNGSRFVSAHNDGSYIMWEINGNGYPEEPAITPYGPYPCKAITKIDCNDTALNGMSRRIFAGGMPRATYGDKFTVSLIYVSENDECNTCLSSVEKHHTVFELSSKIVDFLVIDNDQDDHSSSLLVLAEEEMVMIDLSQCSWTIHSPIPYLHAIHASAVTCMSCVTHVAANVYDRIKASVNVHNSFGHLWPISGGKLIESEETALEANLVLLITGHEDGSVKFWSFENNVMSALAEVKTNKLFAAGDDVLSTATEDETCVDDDSDDWPPFKRIGKFDPYSDDPRLAVKKVAFCGTRGQLVVGGTAGQVITYVLKTPNVEEFSTKTASQVVVKSDLVTEKEGFAWKGHTSMFYCSALVDRVDSTFSVKSILQINPPASINSLVICSDWGLLAAGTAHGLVLFDYIQNVIVTVKCTLNAQDIANADDNPMSRRKSFKKSLRESFRRLRKGRSQRVPAEKNKKKSDKIIKSEILYDFPDENRSPAERAVVARCGSEDGLGSMVRCLQFARTYVASPTNLVASLWAGTNTGQVFIFILDIPGLMVDGAGTRNYDKISRIVAVLGKEIQLKHRAPVVGIQILDATGIPVVIKGAENASVPQRVLITSEEQFKIFSLPSLKPFGKFKITAAEGARIRRLGFATFESATNNNSLSENCIIALTNQGDICIHSLLDLRKLIQYSSAIKKEDIIAISSLIFFDRGEALFQCSSSELQRVSVSAKFPVKLRGTLNLPNKYRPQVTPVINNVSSRIAKSGDATSSSDIHNETNISEASGGGDLTIDSVKDHTIISQQSLSLVSTPPNSNEIKQTTTFIPTVTKLVVNNNEQPTSTATNISEGQNCSFAIDPVSDSFPKSNEDTNVVGFNGSGEDAPLHEDEEAMTCRQPIESHVASVSSSSPPAAVRMCNETME